MTMKRYRIAAILLAAAAMMAVSCSDEAKQPVQTENTDTPTVQDTVAETEVDFSQLSFLERLKYSNAQIPDNLPDVSYGGEEFVIWLRSDPKDPSMAEAENGEVFNDASYAQKRTVEERFDLNITYVHYAGEWGESMERFHSNIMSGDYFTDLLENWNATTASSISQGFYLDISGYDALDITKPWYFEDEIKSGSYYGKMYSAIGFMNPDVVFGEMTCTFFNKKLANDYDLEDMYQVVREGRFTLDYVMNLCKEFYIDVNGDNKRDLGDIYGFVNDPLNGWYHGFAQMGVPLMSLEDNGDYSIALYDRPEACQIILDKLREFNDYDSNIYGVERYNYYNDMFAMGNSLFAIAHLKDLDLMADAEFDYGVLPRFKADENQETYVTTALNNPWSLPVTVKNPERAVIVMTAYAAEGYRQVVPVCYEKSIKTKNVVDEESGEMIDLMLENFRGEPMFYYTDTNLFAHHTFMSDYVKSNKGYGSFVASKEKTIRASVEKILAAYQSIETNERT